MPVARAEDLDRAAQHAFEHVGHAQGLARCVCQRYACAVEGRFFKVNRLGRVGRARRIGEKSDQQRREPIGQREKQYRQHQVEDGMEIDNQARWTGIDMLE